MTAEELSASLQDAGSVQIKLNEGLLLLVDGDVLSVTELAKNDV